MKLSNKPVPLNLQKPFPLSKTIVLVGMMGAGKTSIGRRLAKFFQVPFYDSDHEIEVASGYKIADLFDLYGESAFRDGEKKVILRLLDQPTHVLSTGGGSFLEPQTREKIRQRGISIWLRADIETLLKRVSRRNDRPLLNKGDQLEILSKLMKDRYHIYNEANIVVDSGNEPTAVTVEKVIEKITAYLKY